MSQAAPLPFWKAYTHPEIATAWCHSVKQRQPMFVGAFGFTATALIPGISAAGATPTERQFTATADAEVLLHGSSTRLPTSPAGYPSPVVIAQAIRTGLALPMHLFDCGLDPGLAGLTTVGADPAQCLSTGKALPLGTVQQLFQQGLDWGSKLSQQADYLVIGECVAGGTTTALAVLMGLGWEAGGMVNSSHPVCNHDQKLALVRQGLSQLPGSASSLQVVAAVGDPMQPFVAGLALSASIHSPVMLAGGTQMLAVYALMLKGAAEQQLAWDPARVVVGTTRWVAEDPSGNTVGLAKLLGSVPLLATQLSFADSRYPQLQAYEQGYVKEGVGAGGLAIAANLYQGWQQTELLTAIESTYERIRRG